MRLGQEAHRLARSVAAPTLVIQGSDDQMVRPDLTQKLARRLSSDAMSYREIPGDHELIHEHSRQKTVVSDMILDFLGDET
jgi:alpha-beta hydrolase superfamily lysophospholipase